MCARNVVRRNRPWRSVARRSGAKSGPVLLHDERAVHPHQRSQRSVNRRRKLLTPPDRVRMPELGTWGPFESRDNNLGRQFQDRLLDREHLPAALVA